MLTTSVLALALFLYANKKYFIGSCRYTVNVSAFSSVKEICSLQTEALLESDGAPLIFAITPHVLHVWLEFCNRWGIPKFAKL